MNDRSLAGTITFAPFLALIAILSPTPIAAAAPASEPSMVFASDSSAIEADENLTWAIPFRVENRTAGGIYFDSLVCTVQDLDPGETRGPRVTVLEVSHVVADASVSAGEGHYFSFSAPATAEHARLTFRLGAYRADKSRMAATVSVEAMPGPVSRDHPSRFVRANGKRVEYVVFPAGRDSAPGLLLVHGHGGNARSLMRTAMRIAPRGFTVLLASMPGYGLSEGEPDWAGPATVQALGAALDQLTATPGVDPKRVGAWGISRGAGAVALLAQKRADLRAAVVESGTYDLWAVYRAANPDRRDLIVKTAGKDSAAWRERSAALGAGKPTALLVLHGEKDDLTPVQQARSFAESLKARGSAVESRYFPNGRHDLPPGETMRVALEFLASRLSR